VIEFHLTSVRDWDAVEKSWRALEQRVATSFFQSWTWVGCLAEERYPDPVLLEARDGAETVGLALFNRHRSTLGDCLALQESGVPQLDCPYIEHNGLLGGPASDMLRSVLSGWRPRRLVLSGIDDGTLVVARRVAPLVRLLRSQDAPYVDLTRDFLAGRSANTRQKLRRSDRSYGDVAVQVAANEGEARALLDEMAVLHQATWTARGRPGAFANPFFGRFHHVLIARGWHRGEIDLLRIAAGERLIGILYNFRYRDGALTYQSGFDYASAVGAQRPGLTCHHAAICFSIATGLRRYDFLAGDDRYKRSLSDEAVRLHWVEVGLDPHLTWHAGRVIIQRWARVVAGAVRTNAGIVSRHHGCCFHESSTEAVPTRGERAPSSRSDASD
jgi:CelD/BcsL family acetyltransferase involved in cellulose biosynthesis